MTDRKAREQMTKAIRSYMNEEITAFLFDEALFEASTGTKDQTVQSAQKALWFFYDDCTDHKIVATKEVWDYFNRLLLLLESDGELETIESWRKWHPLQGVAALLLLAFAVLAFRIGFGQHLFAYALPFGPPSMLIAWLNARRLRQTISTSESALTPFPSVSSLRAARRCANGFMRRRCPKAVTDRTIRDPIIEKLMWVPWSIAWCMFSPVALLFQMLPERESETRIKMPDNRTKEMGVNESDHVVKMLQELASFRDPAVVTMFEVYVDRGWLRNLFSENERWIEVHWIDDGHLQLNILSRPPSSAIPANWKHDGESQWLVPMDEMGRLSEWINTEWCHIRNSKDMWLRMWND
jgi:hypothetical protein